MKYGHQTMLRFFELVVLGKPLCIRQVDVVLVLGVHAGQLKRLSSTHHTDVKHSYIL